MPALVFYTIFCKFIHSFDKYSWTSIKEPPITRPAVADPGKGPTPPPLFFNQIEAWRAEKNFFESTPPHLSKGLDECPPPSLSEGLDLPMASNQPRNNCSKE